MDLRQFLKTLPAFEHFSEAHIDVLSGLMAVSSHPAGHQFITQGEQGDMGQHKHGHVPCTVESTFQKTVAPGGYFVGAPHY